MLRFVVEDGTGLSTKIINAETGEDVMAMLAVEYGVEINIGHLVTANARLSMVEADVVAGQTNFLAKHPKLGTYEAVAAIEFRDGTNIRFAIDGTPTLTDKGNPT